MTDDTPTLSGIARPSPEAARRHRACRKRRQRRLVACGLAAVAFAFLMLAILVGSLVASGAKAFVQTHVTLEVFVDPAKIKPQRLVVLKSQHQAFAEGYAPCSKCRP